MYTPDQDGNAYYTDDELYGTTKPGTTPPPGYKPTPTPGVSYDDFLKQTTDSGVGADEAKATADTIYGSQGQDRAGATPPKPVEAPAPTPAPSTGGGGGGGYVAQPTYQQPNWNMPDFSGMFAGQQADRAARQQKADALFDFLMGKAKQAETVDPNDPVIRQQSDTYAANLTRQGRAYLSQLAERKGAGGNIGAEQRMMAEKNAQAGAEHEGSLFQHELDSRRQEIMQSLTQASEFMTAQQQMSLQEELKTIDTIMQKAQMQQQESQFGRNLDLQNRGLAQSASQFGASMGARSNEFNQNLQQRKYEYDTDDEFRRSPYAQQG